MPPPGSLSDPDSGSEAELRRGVSVWSSGSANRRHRAGRARRLEGRPTAPVRAPGLARAGLRRHRSADRRRPDDLAAERRGADDARIRPRPGLRVLEIGTGSGYQAAVLAECVTPGGTVDSIEIVPELGRQAEALLRELGYRNVHVRIGDGYEGWPEHVPFDAIVLTAAPQRVPRPLLDQLKIGGRLVAPVGREEQRLLVITRTEQGLSTEVAADVRFVPMTGRAQGGTDDRRTVARTSASIRDPEDARKGLTADIATLRSSRSLSVS